jgi:hypothetical protein
MSKYVHYWTGYGNLCMTEDGRRRDAQCSSVRSEVTCTRCTENLAAIDNQTEDRLNYGKGCLFAGADGKLTHIPPQKLIK